MATARAGGMAGTGWARFVAGDPRATRLRLGGLGPLEVTELARALGLGALSPRGASRLVAHTEGNALYCRALLDEIGVAGLSTEAAGLPAPRELSTVVLARVAGLPASAQAFLAAAAVLGQHAPALMTTAVAGLPAAGPEMDTVIAARLMREGAAPGEMAFDHPLYRAAVYADLSPTRRRELHARAAAHVPGRAGLVHRVAATLGPDEALATELQAEAVASRAGGDVGAAAWALEQAASLSCSAGDREARLLDAAMTHLAGADTTAAARALSSCQAASARRDALTGLLGVFTCSPHTEARLLAAWRGHDPGTEGEIGARAATSLTNWLVISGRADQALEWADRAVNATDAGTPLRAMARTAQAYGLAAAGRSREGLAALGFLPGSRSEVQVHDLDILIMRGMLNLYSDDLAGAIADLGVATARLRTGTASTYPGPCLSHLSDAHFRRGDWDAAITYAQLATSWAQDADRPLDLARAHARAAQVLALRGQWAAAAEHVGSARAAAERAPVLLAVASAAMAGASLASARGDLEGVLSAIEPVGAANRPGTDGPSTGTSGAGRPSAGEPGAGQPGAGQPSAGQPSAGQPGAGRLGAAGCPGIVNWRAMEVDALVGLGRLDDAHGALDEFEAAVPEGGLASAALAVARCRGNLAVATGDAAQAEAAFAMGHSKAPEVPMPFEHALLSLDDGRRLRAAGNPAEAVAQLEKAHHIFSDLGADPYLQACATELASLEITAPPLSAASQLGLSRAELAVARLVATGLTNREVAGQLFVSVKTVEYHLRNTYMKLDISSRRALTAVLPR